MDRDRLIYTPRSQPSQRLSAGADYLLDAKTRLSRVAAGQSKGFIEAFSNIYRSFCNVLSDRKAGRENTTDTFPTVEGGRARRSLCRGLCAQPYGRRRLDRRIKQPHPSLTEVPLY